jgi:hypothetical protein
MPDERFEIVPLQSLDRPIAPIGEISQHRQIAGVALDRVCRHSSNVAQIREIIVDQSLIAHP